jgi:trigger factor
MPAASLRGIDAVTDTGSESAVAVSDSENATETSKGRMSLAVDVTSAGPCRKRIAVTVPESDIARIRDEALGHFTDRASVPGFRVGRVPRGLIQSKFRRELGDEVKQRVLVESLEQLTEEQDIDPINEPDMDVESLEIPDSGDFNYTFEVEVRPDVHLPDFSALTIDREVASVTDADIERYVSHLLLEYGEKKLKGGVAEVGDMVSASVTFNYKGKTVREMQHFSARLQATLRFPDAEITGFAEALVGATVGDTRTLIAVISNETPYVPMRNETLDAIFEVHSISEFTPAKLDADTLDRIGSESVEQLHEQVRDILDRQITYRQRQSARRQLLELITESNDWELPEELVLKQVENALHREILEMKQAGYTPKEIQARENELRQNSVSMTRQAMKEHFILDRIAEDEDIDVSREDLDFEIMLMAYQSGETPRRLRSKLVKSGVIENLEAQIRERKAVDVALERASYNEVPMTEPLTADLDVESVDEAICNIMFARAIDG